MKCPACHTENIADSLFCEECSAPLDVACPTCGAGNRPTAKFCRKCRASLVDSQQSTVQSSNPASYSPKHLADKILTARSALEGERKQVTVLFADVKGSMELAGQLDPEEWHAILDRFFAILTEGVHRFEGTVNQYTGDGIMALFGAPIAHEDHARRACYAALHLLDGLRAYANELRLRRALNFSARIGINSGEVIVGKIGDDLRMDYTALGHTVGLAARMEQIAEPGKVYLTAHTAALIDGYCALADLGEMEIKGVQGAMHVYELQGLGQMRTRLDVSRSRGFSRFVGRGDEMQLLESALARAREGNAQVVSIVGEAGLGKSRLCFEFLERCRARGLMTYESTGVAHGKAIPFLPLLRLWRAFYGITEQDSDATAREKIAGRLLLLDERLRELLPLVFDFFGVPDPELPVPRMDPELRQRQSFDVVRRVVQVRGRKETTVTLLEDLHWFDGGSEAFLEPYLDAMIGTRGLVILNFRPEYQAPWMGISCTHSWHAASSCLALRWEERDGFLDRARQRISATGAGGEWGIVIDGYQALCWAGMGDAERSVPLARECVERARAGALDIQSLLQGTFLARVLRMVGSQQHQGELEAQIAETLELIEHHGMKGWLPLLLLERAGLARMRDDTAGLARDMTEARRLFAEMGVTGWDDYARSIES
jgi:class 3 adenylate cyclase